MHPLAVFILVLIPGFFHITDRGPVADETFYVSHAWSLSEFGIFGMATKHDNAPEPDARIAPLLPLYIALFVRMNKPFSETIGCLIRTEYDHKTCPHDYRSLKITNHILLALAFAVCWYLLCVITGSRAFSYLTVLLMVVSGGPYYYADHFLTETLYVPLAMIFYLVFALAFHRAGRSGFVISGVLLAILALLRPSFFYLFFILLVLMPVIFLAIRKKVAVTARSTIVSILLFTGSFILVLSPWLIRNYSLFDRPTVTVGYGIHPLSSRVSYNRMTAGEYRAAWIYWLPDFGDSLARDLFGEEDTHRLDFGSPDGFINKVRSDIWRETREAAETARQAGTVDPASTGRLLKKYILDDIYTHIKVTLVLAWRGFFVEKYFGLLGFFAVLWGLCGGIRNERRDYFMIFSLPIVVLLFFHAFLTVSIPRYNLSLLLPMSFCMAAALGGVSTRIIHAWQKARIKN